MARFQDHEKALVLRRQGMSYSQIKTALHISKSTLSCWLRAFPLSKERIRELRDRNEQRIERYRETRRLTRETRLKRCYEEQKKIIFPLSKRELFLAGLFLYWGEGSKAQGDIRVSNTDPAMIKFFVRWLTDCLGVSKEKLKGQLHLYSDMNIEKEIKFWCDIIPIRKDQFIKPYIKTSRLAEINHKGGFGHGTCNIRIGDVRLAEKIFMGLKSVADKYLKMRP